MQGCVVQLAAMAIFGFLVWWLFASGLILKIIEPFAQWYAHQVFPPTPPPSPIPG
jgi:hypothetical protein